MKKIFLWGNYDMFVIGGVKFYKNKEDFLLLTVRTNKNFKQQKEVMLDGIKYLKNEHHNALFPNMRTLFLKEKPDFLAVISGHDSVDTMQEFNRTKFFCEQNGAELIVVKPFNQNGLASLSTVNIYEAISQLP